MIETTIAARAPSVCAIDRRVRWLRGRRRRRHSICAVDGRMSAVDGGARVAVSYGRL